MATDVDTRYLHGLGLTNVEVRQADICTAPLEPGTFDLVHTRLVLMHVTDREAAVRHLVGALRVGGWLCIEEPDFSVMGTAHPPSAAVERVMHAILDDFDAAGADWRFGLAVPATCMGAGVTGVVAEGQLSLLQFGTDGAEPLARLFENVGLDLVRRRLLARHELDAAVEALRPPSTTVICSPLIISTVARKR